MEKLFWIIVAIVVIGLVIWYLKSQKKGPTPAKKPEEPKVPGPTQEKTPPSPPSEGPRTPGASGPPGV